MTLAIASIQKDHQRFDALLACFEAVLENAENGVPANGDLLNAMVDYVESFMDQYHHPKEDEYLFRVLRKRQPELESILNDLREDHYQGRRRLDEVKQALAAFDSHGAQALAPLRKAVAEYVAFERKHIGTEEREVLPKARESLTHEDWEEINAAFAANQDPLFSDNRQRRFDLLFNTIEHLAPPPFGRGEARA
jgi:branched-chain amino acid transport system ATP-binding protein